MKTDFFNIFLWALVCGFGNALIEFFSSKSKNKKRDAILLFFLSSIICFLLGWAFNLFPAKP